jgi:hypothetical protein
LRLLFRHRLIPIHSKDHKYCGIFGKKGMTKINTNKHWYVKQSKLNLTSQYLAKKIVDTTKTQIQDSLLAIHKPFRLSLPNQRCFTDAVIAPDI